MTKKSNILVNAKKILELAKNRCFAIPHININNLEWIQAVLDAAQIARSPIILGVSMGAAKYMGGYKIVHDMVINTIINSVVTVPVILHLDHGDYDSCLKALEAGFTSVMFDGSKLDFADNFQKSHALLKICQQYDASLELEVGSIGGYEDGQQFNGNLADVEQCIKMDTLNIEFLAASVGNIHGVYPDHWSGLDFDRLRQISTSIKSGLVLHGASGIPNDQIRRAIELGVRKINVNTECQIAFVNAIKLYLDTHTNLIDNHNYDPRKYLKIGKQAITKVCLEKMLLFGSTNLY